MTNNLFRALSPEDEGKFHNALLSAYDPQTFDQLLYFKLEKRLDHFASQNDNFQATVFKVIKNARQEGWLNNLIQQAYTYQPNNRKLSEFVTSIVNDWEKFQNLKTAVISDNTTIEQPESLDLQRETNSAKTDHKFSNTSQFMNIAHQKELIKERLKQERFLSLGELKALKEKLHQVPEGMSWLKELLLDRNVLMPIRENAAAVLGYAGNEEAIAEMNHRVKNGELGAVNLLAVFDFHYSGLLLPIAYHLRYAGKLIQTSWRSGWFIIDRSWISIYTISYIFAVIFRIIFLQDEGKLATSDPLDLALIIIGIPIFQSFVPLICVTGILLLGWWPYKRSTTWLTMWILIYLSIGSFLSLLFIMGLFGAESGFALFFYPLLIIPLVITRYINLSNLSNFFIILGTNLSAWLLSLFFDTSNSFATLSVSLTVATLILYQLFIFGKINVQIKRWRDSKYE